MFCSGKREMSEEMMCGRLKYPPVEQLRPGRAELRYTQSGYMFMLRTATVWSELTL